MTGRSKAQRDVAAGALVDAVVVSYNSGVHLRSCIEPLAAAEEIRVIVVDNASADGSLETVAGLDLTAIQLRSNGGFAHGCNVGWRAGTSPFVLFLNPDASMQPEAILQLVRVLHERPAAGAAAPNVVNEDGSLAFSLRWFPRLRSTYARALFLHRLFPRARWTDELIRDASFYERGHAVEWASGACLLVRRSALERIGGWDEQFFMYCEDIDLCRRLWASGSEVWYEPSVVCPHLGGASAPPAGLLPILAESRVRYARKHYGSVARVFERLGLGLDALTHLIVAQGGWRVRGGHLKALKALARRGTTGVITATGGSQGS
jgi:N-acetylglucosaminyl-diphospho-decaprenol L-rhamnosyltransferase